MIGIARGFIASGISRTRSTLRSPFSRLAFPDSKCSDRFPVRPKRLKQSLLGALHIWDKLVQRPITDGAADTRTVVVNHVKTDATGQETMFFARDAV